VITERELTDLRRVERRIVSDARRLRRPAEWRCFWSFPFGHKRNSLHVCMTCGHDANFGELALVVARSRRYL
jgi:hypothetical protein